MGGDFFINYFPTASLLYTIFLIIALTDFGDAPPLSNIREHNLLAIFDKWLQSDLTKSLNCHCPAVKCLGPNVLIKNTYYKDQAFVSGSGK